MILLYMLCVLPLAQGENQCCPQKEVLTGSSRVKYILKEKKPGTAGRDCMDGCVYTKEGEEVGDYCFSSDPTYPVQCTDDGDSCKKNRALVLTGGDTNTTRFNSSELVSYSGVCSSPNIPPFPEATGITAGESTWLETERSLMYCGGSNTFLGRSGTPSTLATLDTCLKLIPGALAWTSGPSMNVNRGWFSLNSINGGEAVAAGGKYRTTIWNTLEKYSAGTWSVMTGVTMNRPLYGHCAVHYTSGGNSYLMIIGGSPNTIGLGTSEVTRINLANGGVDVKPSGVLPALVNHACVIDCEKQNIYVSGGRKDNGDATDAVYKYNIAADSGFTANGYLKNPRWGHIMGLTSGGQMVVAGGWDTTNYLASIESNIGGGITWNEVSPGLSKGREYAAMASVPAFTFGCTGTPWPVSG